jgi:hypothetical protein
MNKIEILEAQYDSSIEHDKPKEYALNKLIEAAKNDSDLSTLYDKLGTLKHPIVSNTIPWLTYLISIVLAILLFRIIKLPRLFPLIYI